LLSLAWLPGLCAVALALAGCGKGESGTASTPATATPQATPAATTPAPQRPAPPEGPGEDLLLELLSAEYQRIRDAGGMPVTVTASGKSTVLQPRVYSLTKEGCRPVPRQPDHFECSVVAMVTFMERDRDPKSHGERIHVRWDPVQGVWKPAK